VKKSGGVKAAREKGKYLVLSSHETEDAIHSRQEFSKNIGCQLYILLDTAEKIELQNILSCDKLSIFLPKRYAKNIFYSENSN